jgi:hypothetical protein
LDARVRQNIQLVAKAIWVHAPESARYDAGMKHAIYSANADVARRAHAHDFLQLVDGLTYLPEGELSLEISTKVTGLYNAHTSMNNFYNEPPIARDLRKLIPSSGNVPKAVNDPYVQTIVLAKLGRPSGVARMAEPLYDEMIDLFGEPQIRSFLKAAVSTQAMAKAQTPMLASRLRDISTRLTPRTVHTGQQAALAFINGLTDAQIANLAADSRFKPLLARV